MEPTLSSEMSLDNWLLVDLQNGVSLPNSFGPSKFVFNFYYMSVRCATKWCPKLLILILAINFPWSHFQDTFYPYQSGQICWRSCLLPVTLQWLTCLCQWLSPGALSFALNSQGGVDVASTFGKNWSASDHGEISTPSPVDSFPKSVSSGQR